MNAKQLDFREIRKQLDSQEWERIDDFSRFRSVYLGTSSEPFPNYCAPWLRKNLTAKEIEEAEKAEKEFETICAMLEEIGVRIGSGTDDRVFAVEYQHQLYSSGKILDLISMWNCC